MSQLDTLPIPGDLTETMLDEAIYIYFSNHKVGPTTLIVGPENIEVAYCIMLGRASGKLLIVPVPGLPVDWWAVCGQHGIVYSPGA